MMRSGGGVGATVPPEASLTLTVLRPAEWRFELRRDSALQRDPLVRTALVVAGDSVTVDE